MLDKNLYMLEVVQYEDAGFGNCIVTGEKYLALVKDNEELKNKIVEILIGKPSTSDGITIYTPMANYETEEEYLGVEVYSPDSNGVLHDIASIYGEYTQNKKEYRIDFSEMDNKNRLLVFYDYDESEDGYKKVEYKS